MEQTVKAQHYVPVFYLKNFADSSGRLRAYDRVKQKFLSPFPKNICHSTFLYETAWEGTEVSLGKHVLCNNIEKKFSEYEGDYPSPKTCSQSLEKSYRHELGSEKSV